MYELKENDTLFGEKGKVISPEIYSFLGEESKNKFKKYELKSIIDSIISTANWSDNVFILEPGYLTNDELVDITIDLENGEFNIENYNEEEIKYILSKGILQLDINGNIIY